MSNRIPSPGISRQNRLSEEGLLRLDQQLAEGRKISKVVLQQWLKRYGDKAKDIMNKYDIDSSEF